MVGFIYVDSSNLGNFWQKGYEGIFMGSSLAFFAFGGF